MDISQLADKLDRLVHHKCETIFLIGDDKSKVIESYAISILISKGLNVITTYPDSLLSEPKVIINAEMAKVNLCSMVLVASKYPTELVNSVVATAEALGIMVRHIYDQDNLNSYIRPIDMLRGSDYDSDEYLSILCRKCEEIAELISFDYEASYNKGGVYYPRNLVKAAYDSIEWDTSNISH